MTTEPRAALAAKPDENRLDVTFRGFVAGYLSARPEGLVFAYDTRWLDTPGAIPLSLTMPLREEPYSDAAVMPWIQNLLPEEEIGRAFALALGVSAGDAYGQLKAAGADVAGAFSFGLPGAAEETGRYQPVRDYVAHHAAHQVARQDARAGGEAGNLRLLLDDLARRPFFVDEDGVRLSLAGGQVKTALAALDADGRPTLDLAGAGIRYAVPYGTAASTLILKPDNPRLLGIVEIEAYCLELARRIGLDAVRWSILDAGGRLALAVARYDRQIRELSDGTAHVRRIHQEDFCQLLGLPPQRKYETATGGGATMGDLFGAARTYLAPRDQLSFLDYVIFNILVGNTDAHAKNYSVLVQSDGVTLAPLYDVSSVLAWDHVSQRHAQKIAGRSRRPAEIGRRHWEAIAAEGGFNARALLRRVDELATQIVHAFRAAQEPVLAAPGATPAIVADIAARIDEHARRIQERL